MAIAPDVQTKIDQIEQGIENAYNAHKIHFSVAKRLAQHLDELKVAAAARTHPGPVSQTTDEVTRIELNEFVLNKNSSEIFRHGESVRVTNREFAVAWLLFVNVGKFVTRTLFNDVVWNGVQITSRSLEQYIYRLRNKLGLKKGSRISIHTAYAFGYRLEVAPPSESRPL